MIMFSSCGAIVCFSKTAGECKIYFQSSRKAICSFHVALEHLVDITARGFREISKKILKNFEKGGIKPSH
jgi:hypothetical protein